MDKSDIYDWAQVSLPTVAKGTSTPKPPGIAKFSVTSKGDGNIYKSPVRREKEPMRYTGKTDWLDYIEHFSAVSEWNKWNTEEMGVQLAMSLTDEAREVLSSLNRLHQYDYDVLTDALTRRFSPEGRESQFSLELMNRVCRPDETVTAYGHAIRRLANIKGLPDKEMKRHVHLTKACNLAQAINSAVTFEAFECPNRSESSELTRKPKPTVNSVKPSQPADKVQTNQDSETDKLAQILNKMCETVTQLNSNVDRLNRQAASSSDRRSSGYHSNKMSNIVCYKCRNQGHYARDCRADVPQSNQQTTTADNRTPTLNNQTSRVPLN